MSQPPSPACSRVAANLLFPQVRHRRIPPPKQTVFQLRTPTITTSSHERQSSRIDDEFSYNIAFAEQRNKHEKAGWRHREHVQRRGGRKSFGRRETAAVMDSKSYWAGMGEGCDPEWSGHGRVHSC